MLHSGVKMMKPTCCAVQRCVWFAAAALAAGAASAATNGFNQAGAGPWDYRATNNWVAGTINGVWDSTLALGAAQTVTFASDTALGTGLAFNYAGNYALVLKSESAGAQTITLNGGIGVNTGGGTAANVTIGDASNHLNVDLGGATNTLTVAAGRTLTLRDGVSNGGIVKAGSGTLTLSGANTYGGGTTLNAGTLQLGNGGAVGTGAVTVNGGTLSGNVTMANNNAIVVNNSCGLGGNINTGAGSFTITKSLTITGGFTIPSVVAGPGLNALDIAVTIPTTTTGVTLSAPITLYSTQTFTVSVGVTSGITLSGAIGDGGAGYGVTFAGTSYFDDTWDSLFLTGANTYTGPTTIESGIKLDLGNGGAAGSLSPLSTIVNSGTLIFRRNNVIAQGTDFGTITGTGRVVNRGGTLILNAPNTYTGVTRLLGGTVILAGAEAAGVSGPLGRGGTIELVNATLQYSPANQYDYSSRFSTAANQRYYVNTGTQTVTWASALISSGGVLTKSGAGVLILAGANTYNGDTTIGAGTLEVGHNSALQNSALVTGAGTLSCSAGVSAPVFGGLKGTTALTLPSGVAGLTLNLAAGVTATYSGVLGSVTPGMSLTKTGQGTQVLSGACAYTGPTTVNAGILRVNGSTHADSAVAVSAGAIGGTGTLNGPVTVSGTGGIDLRDGATGTLKLASTLSFTGAAGADTIYFDLGNNTAATDKIAVTGTVSVLNPVAIQLSQIGFPNRVTAGTYDLLTTATNTLPALDRFVLAMPRAFGQAFSLGLDATSRKLQLTTAAAAPGPATPVWTGASSASWTNAANWTSAEVPGYQSNVAFYDAAAGNLSTRLDSDFDINSLTYAAGATLPTTIAPGAGGTLTIEAGTANGNTAGNGIVVNTPAGGSVTHTISAGVGLAASQAWTVNSGAVLAVGGAVTDLSGMGYTLTKAGAGTLMLNGSTSVGSLYIGYNATASAGSLVLGAGATLSVGNGTSDSLFIGWRDNGTSGAGIGTVDGNASAGISADVGKLEVGGTTGSTGYLYLGALNTITAATELGICKGSWGGPNGYGTVTTAAGSSTTIHTPTMYVGYNVPNGTTGGWGKFTLGTGAALALEGMGGGRAALYVGIMNGGNGANDSTASAMDLSGGGASLRLSSLVVGQRISGRNSGETNAGILTLGSSPANHVDIQGSGNPVVIASGSGNTSYVTGTLTIGNLDATSAVTSTDGGTAILVAYKGDSGTPLGRLNLLGGTLTVTTTGKAIGGGGGTSRLNLGGGARLRAGASSTDWISGLTSATITNSAVFDTAGFSVTVPQPFSGPGALTKAGAGALYLTGANSFSGPLTVEAGALGGAFGSSGGGALTNNATLSPGPAGGIGTFTHAGSAVLGSSSTLRIELGGAVSDTLDAGGTVKLGGALDIATNGVPLSAPEFVLVSAGAGISGAFTATNGLPAGCSLSNGANRVVLLFPSTEPPSVTNAGATVTGVGTALLSGRFLTAARGDVTVCWGTSDGGTSSVDNWQFSTNLGPQQAAVFSANVRGLLYPLTYVYRVYAANAYGDGWSDPAASFVQTQKPGTLTVTDGLVVRLDAGSIDPADTVNEVRISGADVFVKRWEDLSGLNNAASNGTQNDQPKYVAGGLNGLPVVRFAQDDEDNGDRLYLGDLGARFPSAASFYAVATIDSDARYNLFGNRNNDSRWVANSWNESVPGEFRGSRTAMAFASWPQSGSHVYALESSSSLYRFVIDGAQLGSAAGDYHSGSGQTWTLGNRSTNGQQLRGDIAEVLLYSRVLSAAEAAQVGSYLAGKYGLKSEYPPAVAMASSIANLHATNMTAYSGWVNASLNCSGAVYDVWAYWGPTNGATDRTRWASNALVGTFADGVFTATYRVTGLGGSSTNWFTFLASNALDTIWAAPSARFATLDPTRPYMEVRGTNGAVIAAGSVSTAAAPGTDFGYGPAGTAVTHTFTILNRGYADLELTSSPPVTLAGDASFVLTAQPASTVIETNGSVTFTIVFTTPAENLSGTGLVSIANSHAPQNPYTFALRGGPRSGVWTNDASGNWSAAFNWKHRQVARDAAQTASFVADLTAERTVTNDLAGLAIGSLFFSDKAPNNSWTLRGNAIELSNRGGGSTIAVSNGTASVHCVLTGAERVRKTGSGALDLYGANRVSGGVSIDAGWLGARHAAALGTGVVTLNGGGINTYNYTVTSVAGYVFNGSFSAYNAVANTYLGSAPITLNAPITITVANGFYAYGPISGPGGLNAFDITLAHQGGTTYSVTLGTPITLRTNQTATMAGWGTTYSGVIGDAGRGFGFTKAGTGTMVLTAANTYGGETRVSAGVLQVDGSGTLGLGDVTVAAGTLRLNTGTDDAIADGKELRVEAGATVQLDADETVMRLILDGVYQRPGTWGAPGGSAGHPDSHFTGSGILTVLEDAPKQGLLLKLR